MKFTLSWLKDHLKTESRSTRSRASCRRSVSRSRASTNPAERLGAFRIARIVEAKQHPNADKLQVSRSRWTRAPAARGGVRRAQRASRHDRRVRAARHLYPRHEDHAREEARARRRLERHAVSAARAGAFRQAEGIIELPADMATRVGQRYADVLGLADPVFEVKLTPNRPDCTGVRGIARDLAAAGLGTLKPERAISGVEGGSTCARRRSSSSSRRRRATPVPCFAGRYIKGVANGPSPAWMQNAPQGRGPAPHQRARRRDQLHQSGSRPAAACLRRRQAGGRHPRPPRQGRREVSRARRQEHVVDETMCVIADDNAPCWASAASWAARIPAPRKRRRTC